MKLYWRPGKITNGSLIILAIISIIFLILIENMKIIDRKKYYNEKYDASLLTQKGFNLIKERRIKLRGGLNLKEDPAQTGMIGPRLSPITSVVGYLESKLTSANPNFGAVIVQMMKQAGIEKGDTVAIGASGSFPALNIATLAACKVLKLKCIMISSVASSMYGANDPELTWLDMEQILFNAGIIDTKSVAVSIGGEDDFGAQLPDDSKKLILEIIKKHNVALINYSSKQENIQARVEIFKKFAKKNPIKLVVNIGGSEANIGSHITKVILKPGLNKKLPKKIKDHGALTLLMKEYEIPLINLVNINKIAEKYGLPLAPTKQQKVGEGKIFYEINYNVKLTIILFIILVLITILVINFDIGKILEGVPINIKTKKGK